MLGHGLVNDPRLHHRAASKRKTELFAADIISSEKFLFFAAQFIAVKRKTRHVKKHNIWLVELIFRLAWDCNFLVLALLRLSILTLGAAVIESEQQAVVFIEPCTYHGVAVEIIELRGLYLAAQSVVYHGRIFALYGYFYVIKIRYVAVIRFDGVRDKEPQAVRVLAQLINKPVGEIAVLVTDADGAFGIERRQKRRALIGYVLAVFEEPLSPVGRLRVFERRSFAEEYYPAAVLAELFEPVER